VGIVVLGISLYADASVAGGRRFPYTIFLFGQQSSLSLILGDALIS